MSGIIPLTPTERNRIYLEIATALMSTPIWTGRDDTWWDSQDANMKRFRVMLKLYLDYGKEFSGDLAIVDKVGTLEHHRTLIYQLYNDRNKKTTAYLSKDAYQKMKEKKVKNDME